MRHGTAALAVFGAILFLFKGREQPASKWIALFLLSLAGGALIHTAQGLAPPVYVRAFILPISSALIVFLWLAARAYFDDEFAFGRLELGVAGLWFFLISFDYLALVAVVPTSGSFLDIARQALSYALVVHIIYIVHRDMRFDLVEGRRRLRPYFTLILLALYMLNKAGEYHFGYEALPLWFTAFLYGLIFAVIFTGLMSRFKVSTDVLGPGSVEVASVRLDTSTAQKDLIGRLDQLMTMEQVYLESDLSIAMLAQRLNIAEHQLRILINQHMRFRNFRTYLNHYRVQHAKALLSEPDAQARLSILNVAMDSGFGSLASFNRIFKQLVGQTPKEFRTSQNEV